MPKNFGPVVQLGYVVPDIRRAMRHWTDVIGVGPFYLIEHTPFTEVYYRGAPARIDQSAALAQWGDVQVELVEQHDDAPSVNTAFAGRARGGLQHTAVFCDSIEQEFDRLGRRGIRPVQWGAVGEIRFAFLDTDQHDGVMIELIERGPAIESFFQMVKDAARDWDGSEPVRAVSLV